jgi:hypothetical protein
MNPRVYALFSSPVIGFIAGAIHFREFCKTKTQSLKISGNELIIY